MTSPGWYPDPAGTPHTYRYWDGQGWSQVTSTDPFGQVQPPVPPPLVPPAPPVGPPPPPTPSSYGATPAAPSPYGAMPSTPTWSPMPGVPAPASPGGSHAGRIIAIVTAAVAFFVLLVVIVVVGVRSLGSNDAPVALPPSSTSQSPTAPVPTAPATPAAPLGTITPTTMQCEGGLPFMTIARVGATISGGGLTAPSLKSHGYLAAPGQAMAFTFLNKPVQVSKTVSGQWVSPLMLGALPKNNGFRNPQQAARTIVECLADNPGLYPGAYSLTDVAGKKIRVDGHPAYSLIQDVKVHDASTTEPGDTVQVIVVNTGNAKSYGVFVMAVPIGDKALLALQKSTAGQLHVK